MEKNVQNYHLDVKQKEAHPMRVLLVCNKSPYPPKEGGPIAMNAIVEGLIRAGHSVKILAINTNKYFVDLKNIPESYIKNTRLETIYIDLSINPAEAFKNLFSTKSYHIERFISEDFKQKLSTILQEENFDIVQFESLFVTPYFDTVRQYSDAKVVLRAHNIEHLIWERIARNCKNPIKKIYLGHLYRTLKKYELSIIEQVDGIAAITYEDSEFFAKSSSSTPVIDIPFGINPEQYKLVNIQPEFPSLFHLGSMNWMPNLEGIRWFLQNVWPHVNREFPDLKFWLAGRMMPDWLIKVGLANVEVVGEVDDASEFMQSKMVMIVPLFSGSGIRIKIIEGMALQRPIISTSIGAEGIRYNNGKDIIIADSVEEFINAIRKCVSDQNYCTQIGTNARKLIEEKHNNDKLIERLTEFYKKII